jgi:hypothetical protein
MPPRAPTSSLNDLGLTELARAEIVDILFREVLLAASPQGYMVTRADVELCVRRSTEEIVKEVTKRVRRATWFLKRRFPAESIREANSEIQKRTLIFAREALAEAVRELNLKLKPIKDA